MVSDQSAEMLVSGFESACKQAGADDIFVVTSRLRAWWLEHRESIPPLHSRSELVDFIKGWPEELEPLFPVLVLLLSQTVQVLGHELSRSVQRAAVNPEFALPAGRPKALDATQRRQICDAIGDLHRKGVQLTIAQQRVGERYGVSLRTVQSAWRERAKQETSAPESLQDLLGLVGQFARNAKP